MDGHAAKNNESTFPSFVDLDDFLTKHNSNFIWLLVGKSESSLWGKIWRSVEIFILNNVLHVKCKPVSTGSSYILLA